MTGFFTLRRRLRDLRTDESGVTMIYTAIMIPVILGIVGLAAEIVVSHSTSRDVRTIADAAAFAGALETARTPGNEAVIEAAALTEAIANGYDASSGDLIFIEWKPTSGPAMNDTRAVEVIVQLPSPGLFAGLIGAQSQNISARSVARRTSPGSCVLALNDSASGAVSVSGGAVASFPCGMEVNSDATAPPDTLSAPGSVSLSAKTQVLPLLRLATERLLMFCDVAPIKPENGPGEEICMITSTARVSPAAGPLVGGHSMKITSPDDAS